MADPKGTVTSELTKRQRERIAAAEAAIAADRRDHMEYLCEEIAQPLRLNHLHDLLGFLMFLAVFFVVAGILAIIYVLM